MTPSLHADRLLEAARRFGTPLYVYDFDAVSARFATLDQYFGRLFGVSYAIKSNPNLQLMKSMLGLVESFDASSIAEVEQALAAGMEPAKISFSGPAKRPAEIRRAVEARVGQLVVESVAEAQTVSREAAACGRRQPVLVRLNPTRIPRRMGASMGGSASQFGVDEEVLVPELALITAQPAIDLVGFHVYSGSNCLDVAAVVENFGIMADLMRLATATTGIQPARLIFGSGFGVPYTPVDTALDVVAVAAAVMPMMDRLRAETPFATTQLTLEMGRWLVGEAGWLLAGVINAKRSRGVDIRLLDAGFNTNLAAWGMMGTVIRRNWRIANLSNPDGPTACYSLVGPLCTTIDRLATDCELPETRIGDVVAIAGCGAYGLTASPVRFISHPEPGEVAWEKGHLRDVSASLPVPLAVIPPAEQAQEAAE